MRTEEQVVKAYADEIRQRVADLVVARLMALFRQERLSGDDSQLNVWEEICFQVQRGESQYWDAYQWTIDEQLLAVLDSLSYPQRLALWLGTDEGICWIEKNFAEEGVGKDAPADSSILLSELRSCVIQRADKYRSTALEQYKYGSNFSEENE